MSEKTPGQVAYEAYCERRWRASLISGKRLPPFTANSPAICAAWEAAATACCAELEEELQAHVNDAPYLAGAAKRIAELEKELAELKRAISDPAAVWTNMLRGEIAMPQGFSDVESLRGELEKAQARMARIQNQFGRCSACDCVAWSPEKDGVSKCLFCDQKARIVELEKSAASMRTALRHAYVTVPQTDRGNKVMTMIESAMSSNAGKDYVPLSEVEPLIHALNLAESEHDLAQARAEEALKTWRKNHPISQK